MNNETFLSNIRKILWHQSSSVSAKSSHKTNMQKLLHDSWQIDGFIDK